jgi:hypothetical protein
MANLFDQRFLLFKNDKFVKAKKADGSNLDLFKVSATDKWEFAIAPEIGGSALQTETQVDAKVAAEASRAGLIEVDLQAQITQEITDRAAAISQEGLNRSAEIATEAVLRVAADDIISQDIISESNSRVSGDAATLVSANSYTDIHVASEASARSSGDDSTLLSANDYTDIQIIVEATARSSAEAGLQSQIDAISGGGSGSLSALQAELDATQVGVGLDASGGYVVPVLSNYINSTVSIYSAVTTLDAEIKTVSDNLATEVSDRASAVSGLQTQINNVLSNVDGTALDSLSEIVSAFTSADNTLNGAITSLATGLSADIAAEAASRISSDTDLASDIDTGDNNVRAEFAAADATLQANINSELSARISADSALSARIDNEEARAISSETALSGRVGVLEAKAWYKHKVVLSGTDITNGFVSLPHLANVVFAFIDRLAMHETEDFSVSTVGGVSKITFMGDMISGGVTPLEAGDMVYFKYKA